MEFGLPIPGRILPESEWTRTGIKRLPPPGPLGGLQAGGLFIIQTDNPDYWAYIRRVLPVFFVFEEHPDPWPDAPEGRSRREILARSRGLRIFRALGRRRDDITRAEALALAESLPAPTFPSRGPWCDLDAWEERSSPPRHKGHKE
jgi:tRNA (guanine-N7-)-methyltransferase